MWIVTFLLLLCGGLLGASNMIVAKKPDARQLIDKLTPYQGLIGLLMLIWGIVDLTRMFRLFGALSVAPFWTLIFVAATVVELCLGFLLAYGLVHQFVLSKNAEAAAKGEQVRARLAVYQGPLGLASIGIAILYLILAIRR